MKRAVLFLIAGIVIGAGACYLWFNSKGTGAPAGAAADAKPADEDEGVKLTHDVEGHVVVNMSDDMQGDNGINVASPAVSQFSPEIVGYGHVQDPAPLAALLNEIAADRAAYAASSNDLARVKVLSSQGNASIRTLQTAEATALHDQLAMEAAHDRLVLSWSSTVADRDDLPALLQSMAARECVLIRVDLPAGEPLPALPTGARVDSLAGGTGEAQYLGEAASVDPQMQGRGYMFLLKPNSLSLLYGEAVTCHLKLPGDPIPGCVIPRDAIVRTEGHGWVYVWNDTEITRTPIALDHPVADGWFVSQGVAPANKIVVEGAQTLLSEELKASLSGD